MKIAIFHKSAKLKHLCIVHKGTLASFIDYAKASVCVDHNKLCKILKEMGITDPPHRLLRNLYAGQEATVRTGHETIDWFKIGKRVHQGCILSPCLFNLHAEYIMQNAGLDEAQVGIKIARRSINNLIYVDDTTLMVESRGTKATELNWLAYSYFLMLVLIFKVNSADKKQGYNA